ncbi:MAG: hypothetical protein R6U96_04610 [Promethearchaeia archaeon]
MPNYEYLRENVFTKEKAKDFFRLEERERYEIYKTDTDTIHIIYEDDYGESIFVSIFIDALENGEWKTSTIDWCCVAEIILDEGDFKAFRKFKGGELECTLCNNKVSEHDLCTEKNGHKLYICRDCKTNIISMEEDD